MARMIPPQYDQSTSSAAEKRIFHLFEKDPGTDEWFVLHSLGLARRSTGPYGEIDFVVLVPSGAVICLEIKGGRVSCKNGVWQTIDRTGVATEYRKSPFMQAREGMFAVRNTIKEKLGPSSDANHCLFGYAVLFPDVDGPPITPEFETWESFGRSDLQVPISKTISRILSAQRKKFAGARRPIAPESAIRDIRQLLRPDFERVIARPTIVSECESSLVSLTEDQYQVLDIVSNNQRCLVEGAAGTGKTILALEYARRQAAKGKRVLLLCFNRLLGDWFESCVRESRLPPIRATSYFRYLHELVMSSDYRDEFTAAAYGATQHQLFSDLLPFYGQLSAEAVSSQFDVLVIDEAQDLLDSATLDLLGVLLKGGISGGQWYIFGDFTRQCIYGGSSREAHLNTINAATHQFAHTQLRTNCRNTRRIGEETALMSGFSSPPYRLGQIEGLPVDYRYWRDQDHLLAKLTDVVRELLTEGIKAHDLVLLSPRKFSDSVASRLSCDLRGRQSVSVSEIRNGASHSSDDCKLGFATVQAFKGMESSVIILCDIEHVDSDEPQALLYTAMSRARSLLVMLVHESVKKSVAQCLLRRLNESWNQ